MIRAKVSAPDVKEIHGMEFELTTRLPYITVISPHPIKVLYRCELASKQKDDPQVYELKTPVGQLIVKTK